MSKPPPREEHRKKCPMYMQNVKKQMLMIKIGSHILPSSISHSFIHA